MEPLALIGGLAIGILGTVFALWMGYSSARLDEARERTAGSDGGPAVAA